MYNWSFPWKGGLKKGVIYKGEMPTPYELSLTREMRKGRRTLYLMFVMEFLKTLQSAKRHPKRRADESNKDILVKNYSYLTIYLMFRKR